jgi:hypothetical protein
MEVAMTLLMRELWTCGSFELASNVRAFVSATPGTRRDDN